MGRPAASSALTKKANTLNATGEPGWVQCYIDQRDEKLWQTNCTNLVVDPTLEVCKDLGGVSDYGCWQGLSGVERGPTYATNGVVANSCKSIKKTKNNVYLASWKSPNQTTMGVCVKCNKVGCLCTEPGKQKGYKCTDGSSNSCSEVCSSAVVFEKKDAELKGCAAPKLAEPAKPNNSAQETVALERIQMQTWILPEKIQWEIYEEVSKKLKCKSDYYDEWYYLYDEDVSRCKLKAGIPYVLKCMDPYGAGWAGGFITIQNVTYCKEDYEWKAGKAKEVIFVLADKSRLR